MNFLSLKSLVESDQLCGTASAATRADAAQSLARKRLAKRWGVLAAGALLMSGWVAQAQTAADSQAVAARTLPSAATPAPHPASLLRCPEDSPRICTPHGCYCG